MTCTCNVLFDDLLLRLIRLRQNNEAYSMLNENLENLSNYCGTLLHHAVRVGNAEVTRFLIEMGSDVDRSGLAEKTPLMLAVECGRAVCAIVLLEAGASIDVATADGQSALHMAFDFTYYNSHIIQAFMVEVRSKVRTTEELVERLFVAGCTLPHAARLKDIKILKGLLELGSEIDSRDHNGGTALHIAAVLNDVEMVKLLIDCGADVNAQDNNDTSPLFNAACYKNVIALRLLLENGADPNQPDSDFDKTPLFVIFVTGDIGDEGEGIRECAELLLRHGAVPQDLRLFLNTILNFYDWVARSSKVLNCLIAHLAIGKTSATESVMRCANAEDHSKMLELQKYYEVCEETLKMTVFGTTSLLDLLLDSVHKMKIRVRNETFVSKVEDFCSERELRKLCPHYYDILTKCMKKAVRIVKLENEVIPVICDVFHSDHSQLYIFARLVVDYLSERELEQLCQV